METVSASLMIAEAKSRVENLTPVEVEAAMDDECLLVDIREADERGAQGAIPGSILAPRGLLEFWADPTSPAYRDEFDPARRVILYCASGGRSALGAHTLQRMGYRRVAHLDGGLKAWIDAGHHVELTEEGEGGTR